MLRLGLAFKRTKCTGIGDHKKTPSASSVPSTPNLLEVAWEGLTGPQLLPAAAQLPRLCCKSPSPAACGAMPVGLCHVSGCPVGARSRGGTGRDPALCNFAAFYLKPALSQEKRELLGMTVASGNPGEDRVGGKNHRRGPELGRAWRGTAVPSVTGRLRPPPS